MGKNNILRNLQMEEIYDFFPIKEISWKFQENSRIFLFKIEGLQF